MIKTELRPYQQELYDAVRLELARGKRSVCAVLGCGGGKSVIQAAIARSATSRNNRVLFLVHRRELCRQIEDTFTACGVDMSICDISMVQTASRRIDALAAPKLIITDECHHSSSESYRRIYERFADTMRVGFTATPCRLGQGGIGDVYDSLVEGVSTRWLIDNGYLSDYEYYCVKLTDTNGLHTRRGEYIASEVSELMERRAIYGSTLETYRKRADGKKTIIYCASVKASKETIDEFKRAGYSAEHVDGTTPTAERERIINDFREGRINILSNVDLFGEGFDVPDCECVILLRPTLSLTLHIQQSMRSMRYKEGKTALIIDHVGNVYKHGLPDDVREWTLEAKKKTQKNGVLVKQCPRCMKCLPNTAKKCECGYEFAQEERKTDIEVLDVELKKIERADLKYGDYVKCRTFDEMDAFRKAKKYKFMWTLRKCIELGIPYPSKYEYMVRRFMR